MSDTYTAHYVREGVIWVAEVADQPGVRTESSSIPEARQAIREALAQHLGADGARLKIEDKVGFPASFTKAREEIRATRTQEDTSEMLASMTEARTAQEWAEDMDLAYRAPAAVDYLKKFGDRPIPIDEMCYAISIAEQMGMYDGEKAFTSIEQVINPTETSESSA